MSQPHQGDSLKNASIICVRNIPIAWNSSQLNQKAYVGFQTFKHFILLKQIEIKLKPILMIVMYFYHSMDCCSSLSSSFGLLSIFFAKKVIHETHFRLIRFFVKLHSILVVQNMDTFPCRKHKSRSVFQIFLYLSDIIHWPKLLWLIDSLNKTSANLQSSCFWNNGDWQVRE